MDRLARPFEQSVCRQGIFRGRRHFRRPPYRSYGCDADPCRANPRACGRGPSGWPDRSARSTGASPRTLTGDVKVAFYRDIDMFLFPTPWRQEAAPLVIYEALAAGCPVLATDRGLIAEFVPDLGGAVCPRDVDFVNFAVEYLCAQPWTDGARDRRAATIKDWIRAECGRSTLEYRGLLAQLGAPSVSW